MATQRTPAQREAILKARADYLTELCEGTVDVLRERMKFIASLDYDSDYKHGLRDVVELAPGLIAVPL